MKSDKIKYLEGYPLLCQRSAQAQTYLKQLRRASRSAGPDQAANYRALIEAAIARVDATQKALAAFTHGPDPREAVIESLRKELAQNRGWQEKYLASQARLTEQSKELDALKKSYEGVLKVLKAKGRA